MKLALMALAMFGGIVIAVQAAVNTQLRIMIGNPMQATLISFSIGTVGAILYCAIARSPFPSVDIVTTAPLWIWSGGLLGLFFVCSSMIVGAELGTATLLSLVIAGQMLTSLTIDHFGWFNMAVRAADPYRIVGMILVMVGATLVTFGKSLMSLTQ